MRSSHGLSNTNVNNYKNEMSTKYIISKQGVKQKELYVKHINQNNSLNIDATIEMSDTNLVEPH